MDGPIKNRGKNSISYRHFHYELNEWLNDFRECGIIFSFSFHQKAPLLLLLYPHSGWWKGAKRSFKGWKTHTTKSLFFSSARTNKIPPIHLILSRSQWRKEGSPLKLVCGLRGLLAVFGLLLLLLCPAWMNEWRKHANDWGETGK